MNSVNTSQKSKIQAVLNRGGLVEIRPGWYDITGTLTVPDGTRVFAHGAEFHFASPYHAVNMGSETVWEGGSFSANLVGDGEHNERSVFNLGRYYQHTPVFGVRIAGVHLDMAAPWPCAGIWLLGDVSGVEIEGVTFGDSDRLVGVVSSHWGCRQLSDPTQGTVHPGNIVIRNIRAGRLTHAMDNEGSIVTLSATTGVEVSNVRADECWIGLHLSCGDYGFRHAGFEGPPAGVSIRGVDARGCKLAGALIQAKATITGQVVPSMFAIRDSSFTGQGTGEGAVMLVEADGVRLDNCSFLQFPRMSVGKCRDLVETGCRLVG